MKTNLFKKAGIFLVLVSALFMSCDAPKIYPEISAVGWTLENIDNSFWTSEFTPTAFLNVNIKFEKTGLTAADIKSISVTSPKGLTWTFDDADKLESYFDADSALFQVSRLYTKSLESNGSVLEIGDYSIEVTFLSDYILSDTLTVPAPGNLSTNSKTYVYTEDYTGTITSEYTNLPKRATISAAENDAVNSEVEITFNVEDLNIFNGSVWLYNSSNEYIGYIGYFRDFSTGILSSFLNDGSSFYTEGSPNTLTVQYSDLNFESGYSETDIASACVILYDGKQYTASDINSYDTRSISAKYSFN